MCASTVCLFVCVVKQGVLYEPSRAYTARDTKATRSVCERLLERKISSLPLWEEVPRKIEPMNVDGASMCMCTIGLKCVCVCIYIGKGKGEGL